MGSGRECSVRLTVSAPVGFPAQQGGWGQVPFGCVASDRQRPVEKKPVSHQLGFCCSRGGKKHGVSLNPSHTGSYICALPHLAITPVHDCTQQHRFVAILADTGRELL